MANEEQIFALDIGTRTIVGVVMEYEEPVYKIIASEVVEHEQRAMLDGQIHHVDEVARQVKTVKTSLEEKTGTELNRVSIAAAGRALKTVIQDYDMELPHNQVIEDEDIRTLEFAAIRKAQEELAAKGEEDDPAEYHFVGYSVIEYRLDGLVIGNLIGQRGKKMEVDLVVTFLPRIVIDSLLSVIDRVSLEVNHLTLEPIAAADIVIPREMHNFNLALIDIGAGTSDIALTKGGSMIGYAMVPVAGDEITETLAEHYLLDYSRGERIKNKLAQKEEIETRTILGQEITVNREEVLEIITPQVKELASLITAKILKINGKSPQAVICIGGGSLTPLLLDELADQLDLPSDRVGIKDSADIKNLEGEIAAINNAQAITPLAIAINSHHNINKTVFINLEVNGQSVQVFSLGQPTVSDALLAADVDIQKLRGRPGMGLTCTVNGELKTIKGSMGERGYVKKNDQEVELNSPVRSGDIIEYRPGEKGKDAEAVIGDVLPAGAQTAYKIKVNGEQMELKPRIFQNKREVSAEAELEDGADIEYEPLLTVGDAAARLLEIDKKQISNENIEVSINGNKQQVPLSSYSIKVNGEFGDLDRKLKSGLELEIIENEGQSLKVKDILQAEDKSINITLNGSPLSIPGRKKEIRVNGQEVDDEYELQAGDDLSYRIEQVNVSRVLEFINYNLSDNSRSGMAIKINGKEAEFTTPVVEGDSLTINFNRKRENEE